MGTTASIDAGREISVSESEGFGRGRSVGQGRRSPGQLSPGTGRGAKERLGASVGFQSRDTGSTSENAQSILDIVNYDVRESIANAERAAARSNDPAAVFSHELSKRILGSDGMRNRYLEDADNGRTTFDVTAPLTSIDQNSVLTKGSLSVDIAGSPSDGDSSFKKR